MKKQTYNIKIINNQTATVEGILINKYDVKVIIHESLESIKRKDKKYRCYNITEFNTGMTVYSGVGTIKDTLNMFEKLFNDPCLTNFGREDKIKRFKEIIELNIKKYGYANKD